MVIKNVLLLFAVLVLVNSRTEFSARLRNFSFELLHFTALETDNHVVISPFGIWSLVAGVALGAEGRSYEQLRNAFLLPRDSKTMIRGYKNLTKYVSSATSPSVLLKSRNYLFLANDFHLNPDFKRTIETDFGATLNLLNFNNPSDASRSANAQISSAAGGRLNDVLSPDDFLDSRMILTNVISFKGLWALPFNQSDTRREPFFDEQGTKIGEVNMMYQRGALAFSNIKSLSGNVLELPYGEDGSFSMLVILPHQGVTISQMYNNFLTVSLPDIFQKLSEDTDYFGLEDVDCRIPRFKISTNIVMNKPLNDMGVYDIFDPVLARFGKIATESLFVSSIVHKADIEVTETGTTASAATSAAFSNRNTPADFNANKPFVYLVVEKRTQTVLFGGIYSKPTVF